MTGYPTPGPLRQLAFSDSVKYAPVDVASAGDKVGERVVSADVGLDVAGSKPMKSDSPSRLDKNGLHAKTTSTNPTTAMTKNRLGIIS